MRVWKSWEFKNIINFKKVSMTNVNNTDCTLKKYSCLIIILTIFIVKIIYEATIPEDDDLCWLVTGCQWTGINHGRFMKFTFMKIGNESGVLLSLFWIPLICKLNVRIYKKEEKEHIHSLVHILRYHIEWSHSVLAAHLMIRKAKLESRNRLSSLTLSSILPLVNSWILEKVSCQTYRHL